VALISYLQSLQTTFVAYKFQEAVVHFEKTGYF